MLEEKTRREPASFRDPAASVFVNNGRVFRRIYPSYYKEYEHLMLYLYHELLERKLIIPHHEMDSDGDYIEIRPKIIDFFSYPYEWTFSQLKAAALATLEINAIALNNAMWLKDASAYNVQYHEGHWKLIDTCSFAFSSETPWPSYAQFLRHFVNPMLWIKYFNPSFNKMTAIYLDGIPTNFTAHMLPLPTRFNFGYLTHVYSQALDFEVDPQRAFPKMSPLTLQAFLSNLKKFVDNLKYKPNRDRRGWLKYSDAGSYSANGLISKRTTVSRMLEKAHPLRVLDLGANTGEYSLIAANQGASVIAVDSDHDCMFSLQSNRNIMPLVIDVCNPSPGIGWHNTERTSFWDRLGKVDCIMALALIHHLSVRNNIPLGMVADLMAEHCKFLIIEWVPVEDKQAQKLLGHKIIPEYNLTVFIREFGRHFNMRWICPVEESDRVIYMMEAKC